MTTIADIKTRFANMDNLDLIHEFKNIDREAQRMTDRGEEVSETIWNEWNLAEAELLDRMTR